MPQFLQSAKVKLLDEGGVQELFNHIRNLLMATLIIAAGAYGIRQPATVELMSIFDAQFVGFVVLASGVLLALLNALDGLHRLNRQGWHLGFRIATVILYFIGTVRILQLVVLLRSH
jgi:hypothetical protein